MIVQELSSLGGGLHSLSALVSHAIFLQKVGTDVALDGFATLECMLFSTAAFLQKHTDLTDLNTEGFCPE